MTQRQATEAALAAWREAERELTAATDGQIARLRQLADFHRAEFQRLSADHMMDRMDALKEAEDRRRTATPSTPPFHKAAQDEKDIAAEIWAVARVSDEETPQRSESN